jgi:hypothetical protein
MESGESAGSEPDIDVIEERRFRLRESRGLIAVAVAMTSISISSESTGTDNDRGFDCAFDFGVVFAFEALELIGDDHTAAVAAISVERFERFCFLLGRFDFAAALSCTDADVAAADERNRVVHCLCREPSAARSLCC